MVPWLLAKSPSLLLNFASEVNPQLKERHDALFSVKNFASIRCTIAGAFTACFSPQ
jgi:hypothetical protein